MGNMKGNRLVVGNAIFYWDSLPVTFVTLVTHQNKRFSQDWYHINSNYLGPKLAH